LRSADGHHLQLRHRGHPTSRCQKPSTANKYGTPSPDSTSTSSSGSGHTTPSAAAHSSAAATSNSAPNRPVSGCRIRTATCRSLISRNATYKLSQIRSRSAADNPSALDRMSEQARHRRRTVRSRPSDTGAPISPQAHRQSRLLPRRPSLSIHSPARSSRTRIHQPRRGVQP
jgi:hypothetical protein